MLMDLDLQRPRLSDYFGIAPRNEGTLGVLKERATLRNVTVPVSRWQPRAGGYTNSRRQGIRRIDEFSSNGKSAARFKE